MDRELWLIDFGGVIKFCCNCRDVIKCDSPTYFYFVRSYFCKNTTGCMQSTNRLRRRQARTNLTVRVPMRVWPTNYKD